jgi:hypothetical protein
MTAIESDKSIYCAFAELRDDMLGLPVDGVTLIDIAKARELLRLPEKPYSEADKYPWKTGDIVISEERCEGQSGFGAVVCGPVDLDGRTRVVGLRHFLGHGRNRSKAARCSKLRPAPTELVAGQWVVAGEYEPDAVVTYASEPSPETGHVGWCWWARGRMGESDSYESAKLAAEEALR